MFQGTDLAGQKLGGRKLRVGPRRAHTVDAGHGSVKKLSAVPSICAVKRARDHAGGSHS